MSDENGPKKRFDFTISAGSVANWITLVAGGLFTIWTISGQFSQQFTKIEGSIERLGQRLELTVQRLDQRDVAHDERISRIERAYERSRRDYAQ